MCRWASWLTSLQGTWSVRQESMPAPSRRPLLPPHHCPASRAVRLSFFVLAAAVLVASCLVCAPSVSCWHRGRRTLCAPEPGTHALLVGKLRKPGLALPPPPWEGLGCPGGLRRRQGFTGSPVGASLAARFCDSRDEGRDV